MTLAVRPTWIVLLQNIIQLKTGVANNDVFRKRDRTELEKLEDPIQGAMIRQEGTRSMSDMEQDEARTGHGVSPPRDADIRWAKAPQGLLAKAYDVEVGTETESFADLPHIRLFAFTVPVFSVVLYDE
ncbi:hypothetical protein [Nocardia sp.]|uniref:hypothetical protein n=1 Tax=Nocardia sp. TaxID=1821 RepID=UPI0026297FA9|nr:hypothetical protein [Nocardia sp.]